MATEDQTRTTSGKTEAKLGSRPARSPGALQASFQATRLSLIVGVHDIVAETLHRLDLPPFDIPAKQLSKDPDFRDWLTWQPVQVTRVKGRLRCIGNVRIFQAMNAILDPAQEIGCLEIQKITEEQIRKNLVAELLYQTALLRPRSKDLPRLYEAVLTAERTHLITPSLPMQSHASKLLGIDRRRLTKTHLSAADASHKATTTPTESS